jgi:hypothetical protein
MTRNGLSAAGPARWVIAALFAALLMLVVTPVALADGGVAPLWSDVWNAKTPGVVTNVQVAKAPTGDVFVACSILRPTTGHYDVIVARYLPDGTRVWVKPWSRGTAYDDMVEGIAADPDGRLIVCGHSGSGKSGPPDWFVLKFGRAGNLLWSRTIGGAVGLDDRAVDVAVNSRARIFVAGYITAKAGDKDWRLMKLTPDGDTAWSRAYRGAAGLDDTPAAIGLDVDRNIYVTGAEGTGADVRSDAVTVKWDRLGVRGWVATYSGGDEESGVDVAVRRSGVAVAVTTVDEAETTTHGVTAMYTRAGAVVWTGPFVDRDTDSDECRSAGLDALGRSVFGGSETSPAFDAGARLTQRDAGGTSEWYVSHFGGGGLTDDRFNDLYVAVDGTVWVTGAVDGHAVTWSFDAAGVARWYGWNGVYDTVLVDSGDALAVTTSAVYVAGRSGDSLAVMKYVR